MNTKITKPKTLKRIDNTGFRIVWQDDHTSQYDLSYLRALCPCAECCKLRNDGQDVHSLFSNIGIGNIDKIHSAGIQAVDVQLVGRYAIRFHWSDGHRSGIYDFKFLRSICPTEKNKANSEEPGDICD